MNQARVRRQERRKIRHLNNVEKDANQKKEAWNNGKLIRPSSNSYYWEEDYLEEFGKRLSSVMKDMIGKSEDYIIKKFRLYKEAIRDFILKYNPKFTKSSEYFYLKELIETYWDEPENLKLKL
jgi:Ribonuclease G/E